MLEITKTPEKAIQGTGFTSKWLATDSKIVFEVQRKDNNISTTVNDGGKARITISTSNSLFYLSVGEFISVYDSVSGVSFITSVLTKHSDTDYTLNIAYASQQFSYYVAYQKPVNYFFEVKLTVNGVEQAATARFTPQLNGLSKCDISGYIQTYVSDEKTGTYIDNNTAETNQSGNFAFAVSENYIGNTNTTYLVNNNIWYYVKAARSIEKGTNVAEFVPNLEAQAEFLNYFDEPTYWLGLPFDISFVYSELLQGKPIQLIEEHYNSLNVLLSTQSKDVDANAIGYLNSAAIKADSIEPTCDYIKLKLVTDDAQPPVEVNTWYITESPFSPSKPWKFVKTGSTVVASYEYNGVNVARSPLPILDVPDISLIPSVKQDAIYTGTTIVNQLEPFYSKIDLTPISEEYTLFGFEGKVKVILASSHGVGFYSSLEIVIPSTISTVSGYIPYLRNLIFNCADAINTSIGRTQISIIDKGSIIGINDNYSEAIAIYIASSNRVGYNANGIGAPSTYIPSSPINISISQPLFSIYTDGKIKDGWRIKQIGFPDLLLSDNYEFTYSLV